MVIDETWGIPIGRIREFFVQQPDVSRTAEDFLYKNCRITLRELPGQPVGPWSMPRTHIRMEGSDTDVQDIHRRFFLRFLSAGG